MTALGTARIAYVMKRYPRLSETFILNEIAGMERLGAGLELFTLLQPEPPPHHPMVAQIKAALHHLPAGLLGKLNAVLWAHARRLRQSPLRYAAALGNAIRLSLISGRPFNIWKQFARSAFVADKCAGLGVTLIHAHFANTPAAVAWFASTMTGIAFSVTAHAKDLYLTKPRALRAIVRHATFIATCTQYNADYLKRIVAAGDSRKIHVSYHGVDLERFCLCDPATPSHTRGQSPLVLSVGRLVPKKGYADLIAACGVLQREGIRFRCLIVGDGPLRAALQSLIEREGLAEVVKLVGPMTHGELIELYGMAEIFALTPCIVANGDRDGIPNVLVEAMARGVPVVSTSVSGIPELVQNGITGLLAPPGSPVAVADALRKLLGDPSVGERLAAEARARVERFFDSRETIKGLRALMSESATNAACCRDAMDGTAQIVERPA